MPRREGVDALGLPIMTAPSRSRAGSSNAVYPHGGAGSSSSLVNTLMRSQAMASEPNLAAFVVPSPGPGSGPVAASEAPHLSTTESFFGRMTLTAPDNMRRKKAEEREKKKQIRKRRAERGANAAASIANPQDTSSSHMPLQQSVLTNVISTGSTAVTEQPSSTSRRRKRPTLPSRNSGSNLQTYTLEQSRSRSPTRPSRSQSGQNSQSTSRQASPERRSVRRRNRGGSDASAIESGPAAAPTYQHASGSERRDSVPAQQPTTQQLASLPTAAQQRRDIYADLDTLGLPGADESDLEDQPPPFPLNATRPLSPPGMPVDGQEWTEDMRRRQEEYEMNRPPDSPPPAFRSEDEQGTREDSIMSSDEESVAEEIARERQEWEEDVAAGFGLEERIERDRLRREIREEVASWKNDADAPVRQEVSAPVQEVNDQIGSAVPMESPSIAAEDQENANESVSLPTEDLVNKAEPLEQLRVETESPRNPLNLGALVMEARARRTSAAQKKAEEELALKSSQALQSLQENTDPTVDAGKPAGLSLAAALQANLSLPALGSLLPSQRADSPLSQSATTQLLQEATHQPFEVGAVTTETHASVPDPLSRSQEPALPISDAISRMKDTVGAAEPPESQSSAAPPAKRTVVTKASVAIAKEAKKITEQGDQAKQSGKIQPRPSRESQSRFRDGASAAANRRMALWGPAKPSTDASIRSSSAMEPIQIPRASNDEAKDVQMEDATASRAQLLPQASFSSEIAIASDHGSEGEASSDSDGKWEKEEAAFQALQRQNAPPVVEDDSSEEENAVSQNIAQRPLWLRSNSIDLAKPGSSVPRAPPPLVLGRSRGGGAEYSSSSESSSDSGANRMDDSDDESLSPDEVEDLESQGRPSFSASDRPSDKGKRPVRPSLVEVDRTLTAPMPTLSSAGVRAGEFEEDSGSSHDFASDEGDQGHAEERQAVDAMRPPVGNRLKTLFSMPLGNSSQLSTSTTGPPAASRASLGSLFEKQIDAPSAPTSKQTGQSIPDPGRSPSLHQQPSEKSLRAKAWANAYATLESRQQAEPLSEQQARLEALEQISRLQLASTDSSAPSSVDHDSLYALERLLSRRSHVPSFPSAGDDDRRSTLRRSGAINRSGTAAPFVNPRSSIAPRPLGRLPTITNATRHFPPSRQTTEEPFNVPSPNASSASITPRAHRSVVDSANLMTNITESERQGLPEPLEPVKKSREFNPNGPPPPLPLRSSSSRVSAMVDRFEGQRFEQHIPMTSPRSPTRDQSGIAVPSASNDDIARESSLRRRPPPPPPASAHQRISHRPASANITSLPPSSPFLPASSSYSEGLGSVPLKPFKPSFLQEYATQHVPEQSINQLSTSSQTSQSPIHGQRSMMEQPALPPRIRARPLPIPPIFKNTASTSTQTMQVQPLPSLQNSHREGGDGSSSDNYDEQDSASPPTERIPSSSLPATSARAPTREASLGYTDLELFASRLADQAQVDGSNYEDLHLIAEFLGPAKPTGATAKEVEALSVGVIEVLRKRVVGKRENGKDKIKVSLQLMGVKVERCGVCLLQFKEGNLACLFPCLHVLHEDCATKLLRNTKLCPTCREPIA